MSEGWRNEVGTARDEQKAKNKKSNANNKTTNKKTETRIELFVWFPIKIGAIESVCVCVCAEMSLELAISVGNDRIPDNTIRKKRHHLNGGGFFLSLFLK